MPVASEIYLRRPGSVVFKLHSLLRHNIVLEWNNLEGKWIVSEANVTRNNLYRWIFSIQSFWLKLENVIQFLTGLLLLAYLNAVSSFRRSFVPLNSFCKFQRAVWIISLVSKLMEKKYHSFLSRIYWSLLKINQYLKFHVTQFHACGCRLLTMTTLEVYSVRTAFQSIDGVIFHRPVTDGFVLVF